MRVLAYRKEGVDSTSLGNYSPRGFESLPKVGGGLSCVEVYNSTHDNPCIGELPPRTKDLSDDPSMGEIVCMFVPSGQFTSLLDQFPDV